MNQVNQEAANRDDDKAILRLPFEDIVMTHIAPHLENKDLHNMRLTSKAFAHVANSIIEKYSCLYIGCCCGAPTSALARLYCQDLRIIHLSYSRKITDAMMKDLITNNPHIVEFKAMSLDNITSGLYPLSKCQNLTHLEISYMTISDKFLRNLARSNISLQHVTFWSVKGFMGNTLALFFSKQSHLRIIVLIELNAFVRLSLQAIGRVCQELEEITVLNCTMVDDEGVLNIAQNCSRLHTFRLSYKLPFPRILGPHTKYAKVSNNTIKFLQLRNIQLINDLEDNPF